MLSLWGTEQLAPPRPLLEIEVTGFLPPGELRKVFVQHWTFRYDLLTYLLNNRQTKPGSDGYDKSIKSRNRCQISITLRLLLVANGDILLYGWVKDLRKLVCLIKESGSLLTPKTMIKTSLSAYVMGLLVMHKYEYN